MTPTIQPGMNFQLMPPTTMPEGRTCEALMAFRTPELIMTCWKPTPAEITALVAGAVVVLSVLGSQHPPVALTVTRDNR